MKIFITFFILCSLTYELISQTYTYTKVQGEVPFTSNLRNYLTLVYKGPKDNELTGWQELPFKWKFYGKEVDGYYVSDNGYITFDKTAKVSDPNNTALPNPDAPKNAIFAFWDDLKIDAGTSEWANCIRKATIGEAPNRIHIIFWIGFSPAGLPYSTSNNLSFLIALYEQGDFDIIFLAGRKTKILTATIGAQNDDASIGVMVEGSPMIDYTELTADPKDDISYQFKFTDNKVDAAIEKINLPNIIKTGDDLSFDLTIRNFGVETIQSFELTISVSDGKSTKELYARPNNLNLASNKSVKIPFENIFNSENPGNFIILKAKLENVLSINDELDKNPSNDELEAKVFVILGITSNKYVLVEEFTGAWCGWCPDGSLIMMQIDTAVPNAVLVAIHAGGLDSMIIAEGAEIANKYNNGYPSALIDRYHFSDEQTIALTRSKWLSRTKERLNHFSPLSIKIDPPKIDKQQNLVFFDVHVSQSDYVYPGNMRLNVWLVEDRVIGQGKGYDQVNYFSNNQTYKEHPYYSLPNPIPDYPHRYVLRASLTGTWGIPINLPSLDETLKYNFSSSLKYNYKISELSAVAFITYDNHPLFKNEVINSFEVKLNEGTAVNELQNLTPLNYQLYPNPVKQYALIKFRLLKPEYVKANLFDSNGNIINELRNGWHSADQHDIIIDTRNLLSGFYYCVLQIGTEIITEKIIVTK